MKDKIRMYDILNTIEVYGKLTPDAIDDLNYIRDYITNLQEELKEYKMLFDAFSERPYAHRYLEEKKKELGNKNIIGLDSEMIYKDYYDLQEEIHKKEAMYDSLAVDYRLSQEENEKVHKDFDELSERYFFTKSRNEKAIEYINIIKENTPSSTRKDFAKMILIDYKNLLNILNGGDEE